MKEKRNFIAPVVTKVANEDIMAGICNEVFVSTSKAGATSLGYANICYHYQYLDKFDNTYTISDYKAKVISLPKAGTTFVDRTQSGDYTENGNKYSTSLNTGWADFQGTNGTCHYLGYIYYNGVLIDESNIDEFSSGDIVVPITK